MLISQSHPHTIWIMLSFFGKECILWKASSCYIEEKVKMGINNLFVTQIGPEEKKKSVSWIHYVCLDLVYPGSMNLFSDTNIQSMLIAAVYIICCFLISVAYNSTYLIWDLLSLRHRKEFDLVAPGLEKILHTIIFMIHI